VKYYIIAGEPSGDLHGSRLIRELRTLDAEAIIRCWGGDLMAEAGGELVRHYRDLAFMGFAEVLRHLGKIIAHFHFAKRDIRRFHPDAVIFIDYPGFNLRMARWAHQKGFRTIYYISPQVWAWKQKRVKTIQKYVDRMLVILPFEAEFYRQYGYQVQYVGHPLVQIVREAQQKAHQLFDSSRPVIALLPGSRPQEIKRMLPQMLKVTRHFPHYQFIVAQAPAIADYSAWYDPHRYPNVMLARGVTYNLLAQASAALVTSGTATLETALFGVPEAVCYKSTWISYWLARRFIRVPYISLVNLIMNKKIVEECIQQQVNEKTLTRLLDRLLHDEPYIAQIKADYAALREKLDTGNAAQQAAEAIVQFIKNASAGAPAISSQPPETIK
jgi:lipid-A-disaccharide synthase